MTTLNYNHHHHHSKPPYTIFATSQLELVVAIEFLHIILWFLIFHICIDIVQEVLQQQAGDSANKIFDHTTIVANFIKWDNEGNMEGIKGDILHSSNKGSFAASLHCKDTVKVIYFCIYSILLCQYISLLVLK